MDVNQSPSIIKRRGGIQISTQDQVSAKPTVIEVSFFQLDGVWDAECEEVGLAGYGNKDLNIVRENVFDAIKFTLDTEDIEFTEKFISVEELG
jgi:hypothetical protein